MGDGGLEGRMHALERRIAALENVLAALVSSSGDRGEEGEQAIAEWGGLRFMVRPGEDAEAKGQAIRRVIDKADGKLVPDDAGDPA
jgi:hypothetical protein